MRAWQDLFVLFGRIVMYVFLIVISIIVIFPIFYSVMSSFKTLPEIMTGGGIIPKQFVIENYTRAFKEAKFTTYTFNSLLYSTIATIVSLLNVSVIGFCLARQDFIGKKLLRFLILATMFISLGPMTLYPRIFLLKHLGITSSRLSIILGIIIIAGAEVFIFEAYFRSQGKEIDEAAKIDGCGLFKRFFSIGVPLSKPLFGTFSVIFFNRTWNDFFWPYVVTFNNTKIQPLIVAVISLKDTAGESATEWGLLMAGACLAILPVLIVYLFTSKWVIEGVTEGAIKM